MKERSRLGASGSSSGDGEMVRLGVALSLGLAILANLANGLFALSLGGDARGVVARDWEVQGQSGSPGLFLRDIP